MLQSISQIYRLACREIKLAPDEKTVFMRLLREISVNAARNRKAWMIKEDFITLWWMSIGRFAVLIEPMQADIVVAWLRTYLPFELTDAECEFLAN
jgi:hypothetical protein